MARCREPSSIESWPGEACNASAMRLARRLPNDLILMVSRVFLRKLRLPLDNEFNGYDAHRRFDASGLIHNA